MKYVPAIIALIVGGALAIIVTIKAPGGTINPESIGTPLAVAGVIAWFLYPED